MDFLARIQSHLENFYQAPTGIDVRDFIRSSPNLPGLGHLIVEQTQEGADVNLAVLLDRDILSAWEAHAHPATLSKPLSPTDISVPFEEVSHFVYFSWNHAQGRNVTSLEMEIQSEVDRILLAFHGGFSIPSPNRSQILSDLRNKSYAQERYETARRTARAFIQQLRSGDPEAWTLVEFRKLREFFNSNLERKMQIAKS